MPRFLSAFVLAFASILSIAALSCHRAAPSADVAAAPDAASNDHEAAGVRFEEILTGGANASDTLPLVIGIHGFGGSPEDFSDVLAGLSMRARVILPYGIDRQGRGFSWFPLWKNDAEFAAGTRRAADRLVAMIAELVQRRPTRGAPVVTGFSEGGILSFALAVRDPPIVRAAFPISGTLPRPLWPASWPSAQPPPRVHAFHGTADDRIWITDARASVKELKELGFDATITEYPGVGHTTTAEERRDLARAIAETLSP